MYHRTLLALSLACALVVWGCVESPGTQSEPESEGTEADESAPIGGKYDSFFEQGDATNWDEIQARCAAQTADEPIVYANDFAWGYTFEEMAEVSDRIYDSGKRLAHRVWFDPEAGEFRMPFAEFRGGDVTVSRRLIANVRLHIERALERGYASHVHFPDMGHSHLFIPQEHWDATYEDFPTSEWSRMYALLFDDPQLLVLYHTAEQLLILGQDNEILDDRQTQWRFFTRNIVGDNAFAGRLDIHHAPDQVANTVRNYPGHKYWGAGFNISASKDGCFPYLHEGELYWFDISFEDLPYLDDGAGEWGT